MKNKPVVLNKKKIGKIISAFVEDGGIILTIKVSSKYDKIINPLILGGKKNAASIEWTERVE